YFSNLDAYVNVVGGLRLDEPAADLAVAMSLVSSLKDTPVSDDAIVFGEIGLAGEIRSVTHIDARISEAARLGFTKCILPFHSLKQVNVKGNGIQLIGVKNVREAFEALSGC
ncbi:MAG: magnesium chelatase domain-containing protein, partial [Enterococcus thailandicus]|nr:magnesium chelatase domain-containing protein [Enterococcus thailandicus]